ncbi:MAG: DUF4397 domain-containing protein [Clostridia bacterium]|nr:DUF4397 domain-containing protein [Clostridia bacterium]
MRKMFEDPQSISDSNFIRVNPVQSYIRILHASPNTSAVDIYANGSLIAKSVAYRNFTPYIPILPGRININIFPSGLQVNPVYAGTLEISAQSISTLTAIGLSPNISVQKIPDPILNVPLGKVLIRFVHLSPGTPNLDMCLSCGPSLFENVAYTQVTDYAVSDAGTHIFQALLAGTGDSVLFVPHIRLMPNRLYSIYTVGLLGNANTLQALIPLDGGSYIKV